jgi:hypothetical protein
MSSSKVIATLAALALTAGCVTTQEAERAMASRFIGQSSDAFFSTYGVPQSSFPLHNGNTLYTWRGGQSVYHRPAQYQTINPPAAGLGSTTIKTTTHTSHPGPGQTVTETKSKSFTSGISLPQQVMVAPPRDVALFCEAQITVNPQGNISALRVTQDTDGAGLSLSRCAEVFGVK